MDSLLRYRRANGRIVVEIVMIGNEDDDFQKFSYRL